MLAAALMVVACDKGPPSATTSPGAGSAGSADPCPPQVDQYVREAMDATDAYFTRVSDVVKTWTDKTECEAVRVALEPLAPAADDYVKVVESAKSWVKDLSEACRDGLDAKWAGERAKVMEAKFRTIIDHGLAQVKRCEAHPGVQDTAARAIRLMKKRK